MTVRRRWTARDRLFDTSDVFLDRHFAIQRAGWAFFTFLLKNARRRLDALGKYSSDWSAAAFNLQVLSNNSQDNTIDDDDCVMEAADAAPPVKLKIFLESFPDKISTKC